MGIGYEDAVVVYNRYIVDEDEFFVGKRFDGVRVELTHGANQMKSGMESANKCVVKIPHSDDTKAYASPNQWKEMDENEKVEHFTFDPESDNFFVIVKKKDLGIDIVLPVGMIKSSDYEVGFFNFVKGKFDYAFSMSNVDTYSLVPRFEIGGK